MILFLISIAFCLILVYLLLFLLEKFNNVEKIVSIFLIICAYIILTLEISSLIKGLNKPLTILIIQLTIILIIIILLRLMGVGFSRNLDVIKPILNPTALLNFLKNNKLITLFGMVILLAYGLGLFVSIKFPPNTSDVLYNHLSRVGYWLQQGSLEPYKGFIAIGSTYPFNNSLLIYWSVVFLKSDNLVGFIQLFSAIMISITIYEISYRLGFSKTSSILAGLTFLTFPIVILQASTAQNDLLAAAFVCIAFMFALNSFVHQSTSRILFSSLALALALGTKQYTFFILPGYVGLLMFLFVKHKKTARKTLPTWGILLFTCTMAFGMYSYIQNFIFFDSIIGKRMDLITPASEIAEPRLMWEKFTINSSRLLTQYISCEGIPSGMESRCLTSKDNFFSRIYSNETIPIESQKFLLDENESFKISNRPILNEESSWFGIMSWILIFPSVLIGVFYFVIKQNFQAVLLLATALVYFAITAVFKVGWDPYLGRYLILSTALIMPFTAIIFGFFEKRIITRFFILVFSLFSIFIMFFSLLNNESKPLVSKSQLVNIQKWGKNHSVLIQKIAYKLTPLANQWYDIWGLSDFEVKTLGARDYKPPLFLVESFTTENSTLSIIAPEGYVMDYLFFGDGFSRKIFPTTEVNESFLTTIGEDFILISPAFDISDIQGYIHVRSANGWKLFQRET